MPKKSRQAHIPQQSRKRKVRKQQPLRTTSEQRHAPPEPVSETSSAIATAERPEPATSTQTPAGGSRLAARRASAEATRQRYGQLPTFDRAYIMREMRQIGITSGILFGFIIVLTILLR